MDRDAQRSEREERASRWGQWFRPARKDAGLTMREFVLASGGRFSSANVAYWERGDIVPTAENVIVISQILRVDPVTVLRAAGYDLIADAIEGLVTERARLAAVERPAGAEPDPAALFDQFRAQVDDLQARVAQNETDIEAVADVVHGHHRALSETRGEVDGVRADVDALASEARIADRALRGHIDDPQAHEEPDSDVE